MWNAQTIKFFSFQFNEQNENFVFSWFLSSHVMCVIFSVIWIQSVQTSVLFCYRHQYSAFVKSMRFLSDILLIYHHVWVLINMKKAGIFRSLQFYRVPRWFVLGFHSDRWPFCRCRNQMQWWWRGSQNHHLLLWTHWLSKIYCCSLTTALSRKLDSDWPILVSCGQVFPNIFP